MAYLDKHSTVDPPMVSVVSSIPTGGNFLKFFKPLDVNFSLKCKSDLIVKNSNNKYANHNLGSGACLIGKTKDMLDDHRKL